MFDDPEFENYNQFEADTEVPENISLEKVLFNVDVINNPKLGQLSRFKKWIRSADKDPTEAQFDILREMIPLLGMHHLRALDSYTNSTNTNHLEILDNKKRLLSSSRGKCALYLETNKQYRTSPFQHAEDIEHVWSQMSEETREMWQAAADSRTIPEMEKEIDNLINWKSLMLMTSWKSMIKERRRLQNMNAQLRRSPSVAASYSLDTLTQYTRDAGCDTYGTVKKDEYIKAIEQNCNKCTPSKVQLSSKAKTAKQNIMTFLRIHTEYANAREQRMHSQQILDNIQAMGSTNTLGEQKYKEIFGVSYKSWFGRSKNLTAELFRDIKVLDIIRYLFHIWNGSKVHLAGMGNFVVNTVIKQHPKGYRHTITQIDYPYTKIIGEFKTHNLTFVSENAETYNYSTKSRDPITSPTEYESQVTIFVHESLLAASKDPTTHQKNTLCKTMCGFYSDNKLQCEETPGCQYKKDHMWKQASCVPRDGPRQDSNSREMLVSPNNEATIKSLQNANTPLEYSRAAQVLMCFQKKNS